MVEFLILDDLLVGQVLVVGHVTFMIRSAEHSSPVSAIQRYIIVLMRMLNLQL